MLNNMTTEQVVDGIYSSVLLIFFFTFLWVGLSITQTDPDDSVVFGRGLVNKQWFETEKK